MAQNDLRELRENVLGIVSDYSRLAWLGTRMSQFDTEAADLVRGGVPVDGLGAMMLNDWITELLDRDPSPKMWQQISEAARAHALTEYRRTGAEQAWLIVQDHVSEIGNKRGWATVADQVVDGWSSQTRSDFEKSLETELAARKKQSGGCYVATAVYGSYDCPEVWVLRRFRDQVLRRSRGGRLIVRAYYAISPSAVRHGGAALRASARTPLDLLVRELLKRGFAATPYKDVDRSEFA